MFVSQVDRELLGEDAAGELATLIITENPLLLAAFLAYSQNQDEDDLLDSFLRIVARIRANRVLKAEAGQGETDEEEEGSESGNDRGTGSEAAVGQVDPDVYLQQLVLLCPFFTLSPVDLPL